MQIAKCGYSFLAIVVPMLLTIGFLLNRQIICCIFTVMPLLAVEYMLGGKIRMASIGKNRICTSFLIATVAVGLSSCHRTDVESSNVVAFTNVSIIDVTGGLTQHDMTLVINGNHIIVLGETGSTSMPTDALVVDATGKFVIPGLWDMHVHTLQTWPVADSLVYLPDTFFPLFIANGVTGVRDMNGSMDVLRRVRERMQEGSMRGPRVVSAGLMVDGTDWSFGSIAVTSHEDGRNAVHQLAEAGVEFIKVGGLTPRNAYFGVVEAAKELNLPFSGHVPFQITATEASAAGQKSIEHLDGILLGCSSNEQNLRHDAEALIATEGGFSHVWLARVRAEAGALESHDAERCSTLISQLVANQTWQVPTLVQKRATAFLDKPEVFQDPRIAFIPNYLLETWGKDNALTGMYTMEDFENDKRVFTRHMELVGEMHQSGVQFMSGTDAVDPYIFPGSSIHDELELFVQAGLSPMEALQTATWNPARYLEKTDSLGSVSVGKIADLVFLDANPLKNIRNTRQIWAVVLDGEVLDRESIENILSASRERATFGRPQ
jgi:imidazolonepropionase-like amidohydrolase